MAVLLDRLDHRRRYQREISMGLNQSEKTEVYRAFHNVVNGVLPWRELPGFGPARRTAVHVSSRQEPAAAGWRKLLPAVASEKIAEKSFVCVIRRPATLFEYACCLAASQISQARLPHRPRRDLHGLLMGFADITGTAAATLHVGSPRARKDGC
jgi:hypothetical protein